MDNLHSWLICAASFVAQALSYGIYNSFGTLYVGIIDEYNISEEQAAWVGSISFSVSLFSSLFTSSFCGLFGCRTVACVGSILFCIGLGASSFAPNTYIWYITYGIIFAIGNSAVYLASLLIIRHHFERHYSAATGLAGSGVGFGGLFLSKILEVLIENYGLRITLRIMAAFGIIQFIIGLVYSDGDRKGIQKQNNSLLKPQKCVNLKVWKNGAYVIWTISISMFYFVSYIPYVHLVRFAIDIDVPYGKASLLLGYVSAAQSIGKIAFGKLADNPRIHRLYLDQACLLFVSICHTLCPLFSSYLLLVGYTLVFGFFEGGFHAMVVVISGDIVGTVNLHDALGSIYLLCSLSAIFGSPLAGYLFTSTGSYDAAFFLCGGAVVFTCSLMFLIPWFLPESPPTIDKEKILSLEDENDCNEKFNLFPGGNTIMEVNSKEISNLSSDQNLTGEQRTAV